MMNHLNALSLVMTLALPGAAWADHIVGNGGDSIECRKDAGNPFDGTYSLDYILTYRTANDNADIVPAPSWQASLERIKLLFQDKLPELSESFEDFTRNILNADPSQSRIWEEAPWGLVDLKDEATISLVPESCKQDGKVRVVQAVIRQKPEATPRPKRTIIYKYVPEVFKKLAAQSPLQLSFLLVHEWLWDVSKNVDRNRRLNRFFTPISWKSSRATS